MAKGRGKRLVIGLGLLLALLISPAVTTPQQAVAKQVATDFNPAILDQFKDVVSVRPNAPPPPVYASSYLLLDATTAGSVIAKNAEAAVPIASTTKMTTALVARELFELERVITVPKEVGLIPGSDIQLLTGERITVRNLLRGLLIQSGNDAAFTLAYGYDATAYQPFVAKMNEYAKAHGLEHTVFGDPAGLDDEHGRSTAYDLAHTARLLLKDPVLAEIVRTPSLTITSADGSYAHELKNSNRLVVTDSGMFMPNVTGIKTGFTPGAGHCLVASALINKRLMIGVVLNTTEATITASASEMRKLFAWAETNTVVTAY